MGRSGPFGFVDGVGGAGLERRADRPRNFGRVGRDPQSAQTLWPDHHLDRDKLMLKEGNVLWFYDPASKASVRLSPQQRLLGQASNGDVVTVNLARDYGAQLSGEDHINDGDRQPHECVKLDLTAIRDDVTYARIELWVDKTDDHPIKGKFYSDSGRLLKTAFYRRWEEQLGRLRPTETIILDGVDTNLVTRMQFSNYAWREIPESWFQRDFLPRFQGE